MGSYIIRRMLLIVPSFFLVTVIVFLLIRLIPGDIIDMMMAEMGESAANISRADVEHKLGMDEPVHLQYLRWVGVLPKLDGGFSGLLQGDLGDSLWRNTSVIGQILPRLPVTVELGVMALLLSQLIALPIGIYSAVRQNTIGDYVGSSFAIICFAVPSFWLATMIIVFPAIWWGWMPPVVYVSFSEDPLANLQLLFIPALILGMAMSGVTMRYTRTMMLEVLRQDYIRTAWAKGLKERVVIARHALKNALIPIVTLVGLQLPLVVGGSVIIEQIFNLPGMGRLVINALNSRDYPVVAGVNTVFAAFVLLSNLILDLSYGFLDPRIRHK